MMGKLEQWRMDAARLDGWRRRLLALALGALAVTALPPVHLVFMLVPSFVGLIWLVDGSRPGEAQGPISRRLGFTRTAAWSAFAVGWWFGLGFFAAGLYWISFSFLVDASTFAWMIPFALFGLSAAMAVYIGLAAWTAFVFSPAGPARMITLAVSWVIFEWLRGWALTGFPWNLLGTVWAVSDEMLQLTAFTGVFGLSLFTVLAALSPSVLAGTNIPHRQKWLIAGTPWILLAVIWAGGSVRLSNAPLEVVEGVTLRLVQPNIAQRDKWNPTLRGRHFNTLLDLSSAPAADGKKPTHVIWPETATPLFLSSVPEAIRAVSAAVPRGGALLTGAPRRSGGGGQPTEIWNSFHILDDQAEIRATYDKYHLVPFGEYVPFRKFLNISSLTGGRTDFSSGLGPQSLAMPGAPPVVPLICYEAVFPGKVTPADGSGPRPGWLLNLTNDAWFGVSSGPYQHFTATRLRAVEEGLPLVRVANTGLSGIVDAYGRVQVITRLNQKTAVDAPLPKALENRTIFAKYDHLLFWVFSTMFIVISRILHLKLRW